MAVITVRPGETVTVLGVPANLPPVGPVDPGYSPPWAQVGGPRPSHPIALPGDPWWGGGGPVDPGYSPPWATPRPPVDPGYSPPWAQVRPPVDPGYSPPWAQIPIEPPTEPPPVQPPTGDSGKWTWAWDPRQGRWVWVRVPGEGEAGPKA
jgi:hypothetical protein